MLRSSLLVSLLSGVFLVAPNLRAQQPSPVEGSPLQEGASRGEESASPETSREPVWKRALSDFDAGDTDKALGLLRERVLECQGSCGTAHLGALYASLGIVLAAGKGEHRAAVTAFRKALSLDSEIVVLPLYQSSEVLAAFEEARTGERKVAVAGATESSASAEAEKEESPPEAFDFELERERKRQIEQQKKDIILLLNGSIQGGAITFDSGSSERSGGSYHVSGSATLAGMPAENSGFTVGVRALSGIFLTERAPAHVGGSAVVGGSVGKRQENSFGYFLGGWGFQYFPSLQAAGTALSFQAGASMKGFLMGGTVDVILGPNVSVVMIGLDVGFGALL